jgi:SDR family mycofactocin-dependent oxidoreductase
MAEPTHDRSQRRVALVTGAARGIGAATARQLGAAGCAVICLDICHDVAGLSYPMGTREALDSVVADCRAAGGDAIAVEADVRSLEELRAAVAEGVEVFGGIDTVLAAAGIISDGNASWLMTEEQVRDNIDVNLTGVWRTCAVAVPYLLERPKPRSGRIVAIASAAGMRGHPMISAYVAAKHGVIGLIRSLAMELASHGITANAVCPGSTDTGILAATADFYNLESVDEFKVHHPIQRILSADEIAAGVVWLMEPERGGVTGVSLPVDGGMTI